MSQASLVWHVVKITGFDIITVGLKITSLAYNVYLNRKWEGTLQFHKPIEHLLMYAPEVYRAKSYTFIYEKQMLVMISSNTNPWIPTSRWHRIKSFWSILGSWHIYWSSRNRLRLSCADSVATDIFFSLGGRNPGNSGHWVGIGATTWAWAITHPVNILAEAVLCPDLCLASTI